MSSFSIVIGRDCASRFFSNFSSFSLSVQFFSLHLLSVSLLFQQDPYYVSFLSVATCASGRSRDETPNVGFYLIVISQANPVSIINRLTIVTVLRSGGVQQYSMSELCNRVKKLP